jgi:hypothetical protein
MERSKINRWHATGNIAPKHSISTIGPSYVFDRVGFLAVEYTVGEKALFHSRPESLIPAQIFLLD